MAALEAGDITNFFNTVSKEDSLLLLVYNWNHFYQLGFDEPAVLHAFMASHTNHHSIWSDLVPYSEIRERLQEAGQSLPGAGPFAVYRGVAGHGRERRVRGYWWTTSFESAQRVAKQLWECHRLPKPAVYCTTAKEQDVVTYVKDGQEEVFILWPWDIKRTQLVCSMNNGSWRFSAGCRGFDPRQASLWSETNSKPTIAPNLGIGTAVGGAAMSMRESSVVTVTPQPPGYRAVNNEHVVGGTRGLIINVDTNQLRAVSGTSGESAKASQSLAKRLREVIIDLAWQAGPRGITISEAERRIQDHKGHSVSPRFAEHVKRGTLVRVLVGFGRPTKRFPDGEPLYVRRYDEETGRNVNVHWLPEFAPTAVQDHDTPNERLPEKHKPKSVRPGSRKRKGEVA